MTPADASALVVAAAALIGLVVGSFLNVVAYRVPRGRSIVAPPSSCPDCGHRLSWWENLPVLSWALLRGRCHSCREPISARYPVVELLTGLGFAWVTWEARATWASVPYCLLAAAMLAIVLVESGGSAAPPSIGMLGTGLALVAMAAIAVSAGHPLPFVRALLGAVVGILGVALLARRAHGERGEIAPSATGLPVVGCWLGGLPPEAMVAGVATLAIGGAVLVVAERLAVRDRVRAVAGEAPVRDRPQLWLASPSLVLATAMVVSLAVAR